VSNDLTCFIFVVFVYCRKILCTITIVLILHLFAGDTDGILPVKYDSHLRLVCCASDIIINVNVLMFSIIGLQFADLKGW